ncbi:hypothetical protein X975_21473, partial [Stegodyphus mimosarum]
MDIPHITVQGFMADDLQCSKSVRIQFAKFCKEIQIGDIEQLINQHIGKTNVISIGRLSFPNQWEIACKTENAREALIRLGRTRVNGRTCWIYPMNSSEVRGYVHWLPNEIPNDAIIRILEMHGKVLFIEAQKQNKWRVKCDSRYFALQLNTLGRKERIPHFIKISNKTGLITIKGRDPVCFHCKDVGHRKSTCVKFREHLKESSKVTLSQKLEEDHQSAENDKTCKAKHQKAENDNDNFSKDEQQKVENDNFSKDNQQKVENDKTKDKQQKVENDKTKDKQQKVENDETKDKQQKVENDETKDKQQKVEKHDDKTSKGKKHKKRNKKKKKPSRVSATTSDSVSEVK